ncbi:MAG: RuvA C-terminal domain-containing protein, partial [Candidatus Marinimicrobia bacterium]|nr:RuvA C-terminal domain-containing protein [Candidatus Neomarinimicrobiota bacterium]
DKFTEKELSELTSTSALSETYKTVAKESITALESLGFKSNQVHQTVNKLIQENSKYTLEQLIKHSIKLLSKV